MDYHSEMPPSGYVSAAWVKARYSIANSTLYAWIAEGILPAPLRIGPRAVRFSVESLRAFEAKLLASDKPRG